MQALRDVRRNDVLLATVLLAVLVLSAWLGRGTAGGNFDTFASSDFRSGGYAAWFDLMQREGAAVETFARRPAELDARIRTLIVATPVVATNGAARQPPDLAALAAWVARGGQIIALGDGVAFAERGDRDAGRPPRSYRAAHPGGAMHGPLAANVRAIAGLSARRFALQPGRPAAVLLADRGGPIVVYVPYGRGNVVYVTDPLPFANGEIAKADDARLAFLLAQPPQSGVVAFDETLHGALIERSWWQALDAPSRVALCGVLLAILIALIGGALRLGPALALRAKREPASDEFVAAVAALYERSNARRAAIALLAAGAARASGPAAVELRSLAERQTPNDRDLIASALLARSIREGA